MTARVSTDDFPDSINIENVIFDQQKKERSPSKLTYAASKKLHATERFLF